MSCAPTEPVHAFYPPFRKLGRASNTASGAGTSYKTSIDNFTSHDVLWLPSVPHHKP